MNDKSFFEAVEKNNPNADIKLLKRALDFARKAHEGQLRNDGTEYVSHPKDVVLILSKLRTDNATLVAAMLHDTVEDTDVSEEKLRKLFGKEVNMLVRGVTKKHKFEFENRKEYAAENLRKILLAMTKDIRIMLIKIADRLHNMRTLKFRKVEKQKSVSQETMQIYAPIAEKLGLYDIKGELEDLSLRFLNSHVYNDLKNKIAEKRVDRERKTKEIIQEVTDLLEKNNIKCKVTGRAKYFYSIYKKMIKEEKTFDEILDLIGIRIVTVNESDCYKALELLHDKYRPVKNRFKDYIKNPKDNGYKSIHTSVYGPHNKLLEIQIRTLEMHYEAESGVAAHWKYKGTERDKLFDKKIDWLKQLLAWLRESSAATDLIEDIKIDLFENEIIVFTPKGDPISLREDASAVDFAYEVHTNIGHHTKAVKINGKSESLNTKLQSGDVVEIITAKTAHPNRNWLNFVVTSKAKNKIRSYLQITGLSSKQTRKKAEAEEKSENYSEAALTNLINVTGNKGQVKISKCCNPSFGDSICGYQMKDKKIAIHKTNCPNAKIYDENKKVIISWKENGHKEDIEEVHIFCKDRIGLLPQILNSASNYKKIKIISINTRPRKEKIELTFHISVKDQEELDEFLKEIRSDRYVISVIKTLIKKE